MGVGGLFSQRAAGIDAGGEVEDAQPWTATTWSLNSLREWGLDPQVLIERGTPELLAENCRWEYEDLPYWEGEVDCCINAYTLANGLWLGVDVASLTEWFLEHQMSDGGWNCERVQGAAVSSYHSTPNAWRGCWRWRNPEAWYYNVLRAADHFRRVSALEGSTPDPRLEPAIELIRAQQQPDGTWLQARRHPGAVWFHADVEGGEPSPWITFWALLVLRWWDSA